MRRLCNTLIVLQAAAVALLSGCGGSGSSSSTLDASRSCLARLGETVAVADLDYVAQDAAGGALGVRVGGNLATVMFEGTANDAKRTLAGLRVLAGGLDMPVDDILVQKGNVAIEWDRTPTDSQRRLLEDCLSG